MPPNWNIEEPPTAKYFPRHVFLPHCRGRANVRVATLCMRGRWPLNILPVFNHLRLKIIMPNRKGDNFVLAVVIADYDLPHLHALVILQCIEEILGAK